MQRTRIFEGLAVAILGITLAFGAPLGDSSRAATPANITMTVGVCDPTSPQRCAKPDANGALPVTFSGGGGSSAVSIANGADVTQGAIADSVWAGSGSGTSIAIQKYSAGKIEAVRSLLAGTLTVSLPSGASTAAKQPALGTAGTASADVISVQGISGGTNLNVNCAAGCTSGTAQGASTSGVTGGLSFGSVTTAAPSYSNATVNGLSLTTGGALRTEASQATAANLNATVVGTGTFATQATLQAGSALVGKVGFDQTTPGTTNAVSLAQVGATSVSTGNGTAGAGAQRVTIASDNTAFSVNATLQTQTDTVMIGGVNIKEIGATTALTGGVAGSLGVGGLAANNAAASGNPIQQSCIAISAEATVATAAQNASCVTDLAHKQIVLPYANPENFVSGTTAAMTGTTSTSLVAAPASGLRNYITNITCVNSHASVGTFVTVQDGSGGTALYTLAAAAVFGGATISFPTPLRQPTTATALYVADVTTGANVICSATGYKGS